MCGGGEIDLKSWVETLEAYQQAEVMSERKVEEISESLIQFRNRLAKNLKEAKNFLIKAGIINSKGKFTTHYKNLCIPPVKD